MSSGTRLATYPVTMTNPRPDNAPRFLLKRGFNPTRLDVVEAATDEVRACFPVRVIGEEGFMEAAQETINAAIQSMYQMD